MSYKEGQKVNVHAYFSRRVNGVEAWNDEPITECVTIAQVINDDDRYNDSELYWVERSRGGYAYMFEASLTHVTGPAVELPPAAPRPGSRPS